MKFASITERNRFIVENINLVYSVIARYFPGVDVEEYLQEGVIAFIKAIDKFDGDRATKLTTFAFLVIKNELLDYTMRRKIVSDPVSRKTINTIIFVGDDDHILDDAVTVAPFADEIIAADLDKRVMKRLNDKERVFYRMLLNGYKLQNIRAATRLTRKEMRAIAEKIAAIRRELSNE